MRTMFTRAVAAAGAVLVCGAAAAAYGPVRMPVPETHDRLLVIYAHVPDGLVPGATVPVTYTADNPGDSAVRVGMITSAVLVDNEHAASCPSSYFTVRPHASNALVAAGAKSAPLGETIVTFAESSRNQDGCRGATLSVQVTSN